MSAEQAAHRQLRSMLQRVEAVVGRPLTDEEQETVLLTVIGWRALLVRGMAPEAVARVAKQEAATDTMH